MNSDHFDEYGLNPEGVPMALQPTDLSDSRIEKLYELAGEIRTLNAETIFHDKKSTAEGEEIALRDSDTNPTAAWLYRRFGDGSAILTKHDAYRIGRELEIQAIELAEARQTIQRLLEEIAAEAVKS